MIEVPFFGGFLSRWRPMVRLRRRALRNRTIRWGYRRWRSLRRHGPAALLVGALVYALVTEESFSLIDVAKKSVKFLVSYGRVFLPAYFSIRAFQLMQKIKRIVKVGDKTEKLLERVWDTLSWIVGLS